MLHKKIQFIAVVSLLVALAACGGAQNTTKSTQDKATDTPGMTTYSLVNLFTSDVMVSIETAEGNHQMLVPSGEERVLDSRLSATGAEQPSTHIKGLQLTAMGSTEGSTVYGGVTDSHWYQSANGDAEAGFQMWFSGADMHRWYEAQAGNDVSAELHLNHYYLFNDTDYTVIVDVAAYHHDRRRLSVPAGATMKLSEFALDCCARAPSVILADITLFVERNGNLQAFYGLLNDADWTAEDSAVTKGFKAATRHTLHMTQARADAVLMP